MITTLFPLLALLATAPIHVELDDRGDWPAWRGIRNDGVASGSPPLEFGEDTNLRWKSELPGRGLSTPVIVGDRVFLTSAVSAPASPGSVTPEPPSAPGGRGGSAPEPVTETDFLVLAFDRADGSVVWESVARTQVPHQGTHRDGSFAAPSIVTDGERLFVCFGSYGIYAYDLDGEPSWDVDLGDMGIRNAFGEGNSPVRCGEAVILLWDHEGESFLVALDKETGKELWRTGRAHGTNWSTPLVLEGSSGAQIIVASSTTVAYDAATGEALWSCGGGSEPSAERAGDGERGPGSSVRPRERRAGLRVQAPRRRGRRLGLSGRRGRPPLHRGPRRHGRGRGHRPRAQDPGRRPFGAGDELLLRGRTWLHCIAQVN